MTTPSAAQSDSLPLADDQARHAHGILLMSTAMLFLPGLDALAKALATGMIGPPIPALQLGWARFFFQFVLVLPVALIAVAYRSGLRALWPSHWVLVIVRGIMIAMTTVLFFLGLRVMPMADAVSIFFIEPLILTILSVIFLGERVGWRRIVAVGVGMAGVLLVVRPSFESVGWSALYPLAAAMCFAVYLLLTRLLSGREKPITLHLWAGLSGTVFLGAAMIVAAASASGSDGTIALMSALGPPPQWPTAEQWSAMALLGLIATGGHFLVILAFNRSNASTLAPLQYLEIVAATALGYAFFDEWPGPTTWLGIALIVGAGLFVWWRGRHQNA